MQQHVGLFITNDQSGEAFRIIARYAFVIPVEDTHTIARLPAIQYTLNMVQLDYDPTDGEVQGQARLPGYGRSNKPDLARLLRRITNDFEKVARELAADGTTGPFPRRRSPLGPSTWPSIQAVGESITPPASIGRSPHPAHR